MSWGVHEPGTLKSGGVSEEGRRIRLRCARHDRGHDLPAHGGWAAARRPFTSDDDQLVALTATGGRHDGSCVGVPRVSILARHCLDLRVDARLLGAGAHPNPASRLVRASAAVGGSRVLPPSATGAAAEGTQGSGLHPRRLVAADGTPAVAKIDGGRGVHIWPLIALATGRTTYLSQERSPCPSTSPSQSGTRGRCQSWSMGFIDRPWRSQ